MSIFNRTTWRSLKRLTHGIQLKKKLREQYHSLRFKVQARYIDQLILREGAMMREEKVYNQFSQWLTHLQINGLFTVTPFLPEVDLVARLCKDKSIPVIASIHSFDNVTKRGWQSVVFDHYIVWNKYNKAELQRIHKPLQKKGMITIAGAPQFDFHFDEKFSWSRQQWLDKLGLPNNKKIILYSGGPVSLLPDEPQYLKALKEAFEKGDISQDHIVLFRCHPLDKVERWKKYVGESPYIVYDSAPNGQTKLDYVNVFFEDIRKLMSTLKYTELHINVVSTMAVDGSAFHKPQIGPYYDEVNPATQDLFRQMYYQEHYRPIMKSKVVNLAHTKTQFIELVNSIIENPAAHIANCDQCVQEIITFSDGQSTNRAVAAIQKFYGA